MSDALNVLRVFQVVVVLLGSVVVYYASKGYQKTRSSSLLFLGLGFVFVTVGAIASGLLFEILSVSLLYVTTVEAACQVTGFLLIVYSILGTRD